ncbi:NADH:flavin oxidoreductase [uncultured Muribaculum sp.]|uniref:NADH:flavin oxidoreductase n=1 Tax=uncultured Muribaculum sp. TaxID=1918613 RepID=UPI002591645E|nr:NADH:flavin oxidoreductase [uncultured Muribaculum sp.]
MYENSKLFTPVNIGPVTLRNRTIRSAAFEGMCPGNSPSQQLKDYHVSVAEGGVGMTTLAYASVTRNGLSFPRQLWMRREIVEPLRDITDAIHAAGAKASIQLGHCGNMSHKSTAGETPISATGRFNIYSPTPVRRMRDDEIVAMSRSFGDAVRLARDAGMDCVEIHAGHGYLISQFLSPYTNRRRDRWGGSLDNRMRFMRMCMEEVMKAAGSDIGVVVKTNMRDGFKGGIELDEGVLVAKELERLGVHALVLSGGFVSKAPMYVMRGEMPIGALTHYMDTWWLKYGVRMFGKMMIPTVPYKECYFLDDARMFRRELKMPLIYVGGCSTRQSIERVLDEGFDAVQMARSLLTMPDFVNRMRDEGIESSGCDHVNYCIGRMYTLEMACHKCVKDLPRSLQKEIEEIKSRQS